MNCVMSNYRKLGEPSKAGTDQIQMGLPDFDNGAGDRFDRSDVGGADVVDDDSRGDSED